MGRVTTDSAPPRSRATRRVLLAAIALGTGVLLVGRITWPGDGLVAALGLLGSAVLLLRTLLPPITGRTDDAMLLVMLLAGGLSAPGTDGLGSAALVAALLSVLSDPRRSRAVTIGTPLVGALALGIGMLIGDPAIELAIGLTAMLALVALSGLARRSTRRWEQAERAALENAVAVEHERARSATFEERARIARDLHDVLAHTLGGLVVQLDAVDAELEADRTGDARARAARARDLAAAGMDEARRAVAALRGTDADTEAAVRSLAETHRVLGGDLTLTTSGHASEHAPTVEVVRRAAQELLVNARRHAPGAPVEVRLAQGPTIRLAVSTPRPGSSTADSPGGGAGLAGLRERATAAGGSVTIDPCDPFVVTVEVPR
jgi:signal transduction histidine kinase